MKKGILRTASVLRLALALLATSALMLVPVAAAWGETVVRVGFYDNRPLSFVGPGGAYKGITVDLLEHVARQEGWRLEYVPGTWAQALERLEHGNIDLLSPIAYSEERAKRFDFNKETLINNWGQVYLPSDSAIDTILDLAGKRIAVLGNDIYERHFLDLLERFNIRCEIVQVVDYHEVFSLLRDQRVDAGVVNRLFGRQFENRYGVRRSSIVFLPIDVRYAAPKGGGDRLLATLDARLRELKQDKSSRYYGVIDRYLGNTESRVFSKWVKWGLFIAAALLLLLGTLSLLLRVQVRAKTRALAERNRLLEKEIEERQLAEVALKESEGRYRSLVENIDLGISLKDRRHRFVTTNTALGRLTGVPTENLSGKVCYQALWNNDSPCSDCPGTVAMTVLEPHTIERLRKHPDGRDITLRIHAFPLKDGQGQASGFIEVVEDITREKEIDRLRIELLSTAAHEFRTPLASIFGFAELLLSLEEVSAEDQREYLTYIYEKSEDLSSLVDQLLDVTRIDEGRGLDLNLKPCTLEEVMERAVRPFRTRSKSVRLEVELAPDLAVLQADRGKIEQVMENLLSNAFKYSPRGGRVLVAGERDGDMCRVTVSDQGIGMTPAQQERAFEKFYRADTSDTAPSGTGIGLSIARSIIESHNGEIWLESTAGQGTTVHFTIPLHSAARSA
ncbi:MAG: hypothetical protein C0617_12550 [Desulfuromonas sp.]|nr:MAG: hypothetical protein C0617_12550 [Desulfuromonas sp.]